MGMLAPRGRTIGAMSEVSPRALAAKARAAKRWYVYLILCRNGAIYTGIARSVGARYASERRSLRLNTCGHSSYLSTVSPSINRLNAVASIDLFESFPGRLCCCRP
jgi:hypothetical protein